MSPSCVHHGYPDALPILNLVHVLVHGLADHFKSLATENVVTHELLQFEIGVIEQTVFEPAGQSSFRFAIFPADQLLDLLPELRIFGQGLMVYEIGRLRRIWWSGRLDLSPVNALEERMRLELPRPSCTKAINEVPAEELTNEVLGSQRDHILFLSDLWPVNAELDDVSDNFLNRLPAEWFTADKQLIGNHSETPPVDCEVIRGQVVDDLWRDIVRGADQSRILL